MYREAAYARRRRRGARRTGSRRRRAAVRAGVPRERSIARSRASASPSGPSTATRRWRGSRELRGARPAAAGRPLAQVVPDATRSAPLPPAERDWGTAAAVAAAVLRGRAHRARARGRRRWSQVVRVADAIRAAARVAGRDVTSAEPSQLDRRDCAIFRLVGPSLDILIVAVAIYELLKLIRGTRAVQMGIGAGLLVARVLPVAVVATSRRSTGSSATWSATSSSRDRAVPDRHPPRARAPRPGAASSATSRAPSRTDETIEEIVVAATMLASQRIGAIIADRARHRPAQLHRGRHPARRDADLRPAGEHLPAGLAAARRRGHRPGRPDRGRRVLPAADREPRGQQGLRHPAPGRDRPDRGDRRRRPWSCRRRPGRISLALDGGIESGLTPTRCARACATLLPPRRPRAESRESSQQAYRLMAYHPFRHLGLKSSSVGIALLLWFAVGGEQTVERSLRVAAGAAEPPRRGSSWSASAPSTVDVRVRGASAVLSQLRPGDVVAVLDLSPRRPGRTLLPPRARPGARAVRRRGERREARRPCR